MARTTDNGGPRKSDELLWLETYFIVFPHKRRPTLAQVERALSEANPRLHLENRAADDEGRFQSLLVESPEDNAAVEVSYETGEAVVEQNLQLASQLEKQLAPTQREQLVAADARLDLAHFERVKAGAPGSKLKSDRPRGQADPLAALAEEFSDDFNDDFDDDFDEEAAMEVFDPTCLLTVVEALSTLTKGLTFDPASGQVV